MPHNAPPKKSYLEIIQEMYPEEFSNKPKTLKQQLHEIDQIVAIEQGHLDNTEPLYYGSKSEDDIREIEKYRRDAQLRELLNDETFAGK